MYPLYDDMVTRIGKQQDRLFGERTEYVYYAPGAVRISVYDLAGRRVRLVAESRYPAGDHELRWNGFDDQGRKLGSGIYFVRIATPAGVDSKRVVFLN